MGRDSGAENRWQGYSHQELYDMLHSGPGSTAAGAAADRWSRMAGALADIQQDISTGVNGSGATWVGAAADSARGALGPLGDWAQQASAAADMMRISTELQGDLIGKARAEMPVPVPAPPPTSPISQLITGQVDHEVIELAHEAAAQQAYQVMAQYEAGTTDNTSTLGDFGEPPELVVDTAPITGVAVRGPVRFGSSVRQVPRGATGERATPMTERSAGTARPGTASSGRTTRATGSAPREVEATPGEPASAGKASGAPASPRTPGTTTSTSSASSAEGTGQAAGPQEQAGPRPTAGPAQSTATSSAPTGRNTPVADPRQATGRTPGGVGNGGSGGSGGSGRFGGTTTTSGIPAPDSGDNRGGGGGSVGMPVTGAVVPAARRPEQEDEPDDLLHESKYLIEADDIYGDRLSYSPPVIGESRRRR
jgi:hypothetical protein